jgi:hypothetical protein
MDWEEKIRGHRLINFCEKSTLSSPLDCLRNLREDFTPSTRRLRLTSLSLHTVKHRFRNIMKEGTVSVHNILVAKISTILKKIIKLKKGEPKWDLEKLCA